MRGLYRTQRWLYREQPETLANVIRPYFPDIALPLLQASVARYKALGIWGRNPILPEAGYERLSNHAIALG